MKVINTIPMLGTLALILFILWIAGFSFHVLGGFVHIALVIAIILAIAHFLTGTKV